ncbi:MAG: hypothetical protein ACRCZI_07880 [Cetobacterium sp.]
MPLIRDANTDVHQLIFYEGEEAVAEAAQDEVERVPALFAEEVVARFQVVDVAFNHRDAAGATTMANGDDDCGDIAHKAAGAGRAQAKAPKTFFATEVFGIGGDIVGRLFTEAVGICGDIVGRRDHGRN